MPQGISADLIATKYGFSRDDVDAYAVESQKRAGKSWEEGRFKNSVIAGEGRQRLTLLAKDEHMRPTTTMQTLGAAQSVVRADGRDGGLRRGGDPALSRDRGDQSRPHAGNSSGIVDGAAAVLIGNKEAGTAAGLKPRARIGPFANIGSEPVDHADRADRR